MQKIIVLFLVFAIVNTTQARTAKEMFLTMPDSVIPYLSLDTRQTMLEHPDSMVLAPNEFGGCTIKRIADNILTIDIDGNISIEIGQLTTNRYIIITTCSSPERESRCIICDSLWQNTRQLSFDKINFFADTATVEQRKMVEFPLIEAHLGNEAKTLILQLNPPMLSAEDKKVLNPYLERRTLKWNGESFN